MDFYSRVKSEVKKKKLSLQEFIIGLEINHDTYYAQKRAGNLPRADEAHRIAQALGTTVEFLVTGEHQKTSVINEAFNEIEGIIKKYRN